MDVTVDLTGFVIRSSAAVAFGGDEGVAGPVAFTETNGGKPIATSPNIGFVSKNDTMVPSAGGLAGLAVSLVVSAAINVASDAAVDSADHLSTNYAQSARKWLQLEPYVFPE